MAIVLAKGAVSLTLPDGLMPSDEWINWSPSVQSVDYSLGGAVIVESAERLAGAPLTLEGGERYVWMTGAQCDALDALLDDPSATLTLTLHDGIARSVLPRLDNGRKALSRTQLIGVADPSATTRYVIDRLAFWEI